MTAPRRDQPDEACAELGSGMNHCPSSIKDLNQMRPELSTTLRVALKVQPQLNQRGQSSHSRCARARSFPTLT